MGKERQPRQPRTRVRFSPRKERVAELRVCPAVRSASLGEREAFDVWGWVSPGLPGLSHPSALAMTGFDGFFVRRKVWEFAWQA